MKNTPQQIAKVLSITPDKAQSLMSWAHRKARTMAIKSRTTTTYYAEHDEWDSKYGVDINYYITENAVLKIIGYPIFDGQTDTSIDSEVILATAKVRVAR